MIKLFMFTLLMFNIPIVGQWVNVPSPTGHTLNAIHFVNNISGYIVGGNMVVLKTSDAGESWFLIHSTSSNAFSFRSVFFINDTLGFATGYIGEVSEKIFKTIDGGYNWNAITVGNSYSFEDIVFVKDSIGFLAGEHLDNSYTWNAVILKTTDQGNSWTQSYYSFDGNIQSLKFLNENYGFAVGTDYPNGLTLKTTNGGLNWIQKNNTYPIRLVSVDLIDSLNIVASGKGGSIIKSTDAGENWFTLVSNLSWASLPAIEFSSINRGNVISLDGEIFFSSDTGNNWVNSSTGNPSLRDLVFFNDTIGIVVGNAGIILRTKNGGLTFIDNEENNFTHPKKFSLDQNYPNPFNPSTIIRYQLPKAGNVTLTVFDVLGKEIATLVDEYRNAGSYEVELNSESSIKNPASGIYFYQLKSGDFVETKKMILLK